MRQKITQTTMKNLSIATHPYEINDTDLKGFLLRVQPSGKMTYYFAYRINGRRARYKIGQYPGVKPAPARDVAEQLAAKVAQGIDPQSEKKQAKQDEERQALRTLSGFLDKRYEPWVKVERKTGEAMVRRIRTCFVDLLDRPMVEISPWVIDKWRAQRLREKRAATTVNRDIVALKSALGKAVEWSLIARHPLASVKPLKTDARGKVRYLSKDEEERLRKALVDREMKLRAGRESANEWRRQRGYPLYPDISRSTFADHLRPMLLLALNTGLRRGELFNLCWGDVNLQTCTLTIAGHRAKSGQTLHIPLNDEAVSALREWKTADTGLVFPGKDGKPLDNVRKSWETVLEAAKITGFRFHDLRHTFASKLVMAGVDLNTVRELLGHADLKMTLRYAHLAPEHKADAVARLVTA